MKPSLLVDRPALRRRRLCRPPRPENPGIEGKDYKWNAQGGEKSEALNKKGDAKAGEEGYETCGACHLPSAPVARTALSRNLPASTPPC